LQTRCPHCKTLFEIHEIQLRAASGQARCSCCDNIFNARKHLTKTEPVEQPAAAEDQPKTSGGAISLNGLFAESEPEYGAFPDFDTATLSTESDGHREPQNKDEKQSEAGLTKPAIDTEESKFDGNTDSLRNGLSITAIAEKPETGRGIQATVVAGPAEDVLHQFQQRETADPEGLSGRRLKPESILPYSQGSGTERGGHPVLWSIGIVLLLAAALAQITWFMRGDLKRYPEVRELLESVCTQTGCELPPWREPERFVISSRVVRTHPNNSNALQIQLVFNNTARFAQSYPQLQLKLYDINEKLTSQRVFRPDEYLAVPQHEAALIEPQQSVQVEMALVDPGAGVTGFKIEFL